MSSGKDKKKSLMWDGDYPQKLWYYHKCRKDSKPSNNFWLVFHQLDMQWVILVPWNGFIGTIQQRKFNIKIVMSSNIQSQGDRLVDIERSVGGHRGLSLDFSRGSILGIISEGGGHEKSLTATSKSMPPERRDGINNKQNFNGNLLASADRSFNFCLIPVHM